MSLQSCSAGVSHHICAIKSVRKRVNAGQTQPSHRFSDFLHQDRFVKQEVTGDRQHVARSLWLLNLCLEPKHLCPFPATEAECFCSNSNELTNLIENLLMWPQHLVFILH